MKFKPGQKVMVMKRSPFGAISEEGKAIIVCDNDFASNSFQSCDVRFVKDIKRDGPNCPVYIRWIDTRKITKLPLKTEGLLQCCIETLRATPVEGKEGEVLPCNCCSESLVLRNGCWEWNPQVEETKP